MIVLFPDSSRTTVSYPKYLVERLLDRYLKENETVDHIDNNPLNNDPSNLRIVLRKEHAQDEAPTKKPKSFDCPLCGESFTLVGVRLSNAVQNRKKEKLAHFVPEDALDVMGAVSRTDILNDSLLWRSLLKR